jgi:tetratricopeptide (TPR) repeat protein
VHPKVAELNKKARSLYESQKYDEAAEVCKEAMTIVDKQITGNEALKTRSEILLLFSDINDLRGAWVDALLYLDNVVQNSMTLGDNRQAIEALLRAGKLLTRKAKWQDAISKFQRAEGLCMKHNTKMLLGKALAGLGTANWRLGKYQEAIGYGERAINLGRETSDNNLLGEALSLVANIKFDQGDYKRSIQINAEGIAAYERAGNHYDTARLLNNQGETYKVIEDYKNAIKFLEKAVDICTEYKVARVKSYALNNIAECQMRLGEVQKAKETAKLNQDLLRDSEDKYVKSTLNMVFGMVYSTGGNMEKAEASFQKALKGMEELSIPYDTGLVQLEYGIALSKDGKVEEAARELKKAVATFEKAGADGMAAKARKSLSEASKGA